MKFYDVICKRGSAGAETNIKHKVVLHSPTGFEWGYGGSGPAELALNILASMVDRKFADEYHQQFKWDFIASLPEQGGVIKAKDIEDWVNKIKEEVK